MIRPLVYVTGSAGIAFLTAQTFVMAPFAALACGVGVWAAVFLSALVLDAIVVEFFTSGLMG